MIFDDFARRVRTEIPKCPMPTIRHAMRQIINEWCHDTWMLKSAHPVRGDSDGNCMIDLGTDSKVLIWAMGECVDDCGVASTLFENDLLSEKTSHGPGIGYAIDPSRTRVSIAPVRPNGVYNVQLIFEPASHDMDLPVTFNAWERPLVSGAKARLFEMVGEVWSNPQMAAYHYGVWEQGKGKARGKFLMQASHRRKGKRAI